MPLTARGVAVLALATIFGVSMVVAIVAGVELGGLETPDEPTVEEVLAIPANDPQAVADAVARISDPVVRQTALLEWIRRNRSAHLPMALSPLCALLDADGEVLCARRVGSPHLDARAPTAP